MTKKAAFAIVGAIVAGGLAFPLISAEVSGVGPEARAYPERLRRAEALGFDTEFARQTAADNARPASARAAFDEMQAFLKDPRRFEFSEKSSARVIPASRRKPPRTLESYRADLRRFGEFGRRAAGGAHYKWSYELILPEYSGLKNAAKVADALARADAALGDYEAATDDLEDAAAPWAAYGDSPILIGDLVLSATTSILTRASGALFARPGLPASEARRLGALAEGPLFRPHLSLRAMLLSETAMLHKMLEHPPVDANAISTGSPENPRTRMLNWGMRSPQVRRAWQSDALRLMNDAIPHMPADPYDFDGGKRVLEGYEHEALRERGLVGVMMEEAGMTSYGGVADAQRRREANRRVWALAAAMRAGESEAAARARLGRFAIDPYDGKPLRVVPAAEIPEWLGKILPGLKFADYRAVYSIGPDGVDDGGRLGKRSDRGDLVLVIPKAR